MAQSGRLAQPQRRARQRGHDQRPRGDDGDRQARGRGPRAPSLPLGIEGDEQADLTVHGGLSKAVYAYPSEHYAVLADGARAGRRRARGTSRCRPAALGENLTLAGVVESEVFIGDVLRFPGCALAVSEPRFPCFKFNAAMGFKHAAKLMVAERLVRLVPRRCASRARSPPARPSRSSRGRARSASSSCSAPARAGLALARARDARLSPRLSRRQPCRRAQAPRADAGAAPSRHKDKGYRFVDTHAGAGGYSLHGRYAKKKRRVRARHRPALDPRRPAGAARRLRRAGARASIPTACSPSTPARRRSRRCCCARRTSCARSSCTRPSRRSCARPRRRPPRDGLRRRRLRRPARAAAAAVAPRRGADRPELRGQRRLRPRSSPPCARRWRASPKASTSSGIRRSASSRRRSCRAGSRRWRRRAGCTRGSRVQEPDAQGFGLAGSGVFVLNPPHTLHATLAATLPYLVDVLGRYAGANFADRPRRRLTARRQRAGCTATTGASPVTPAAARASGRGTPRTATSACRPAACTACAARRAAAGRRDAPARSPGRRGAAARPATPPGSA